MVLKWQGSVKNKLECLPLSITITLLYYLWARQEPTQVEPLIGLHTKGKISPWLANFLNRVFVERDRLFTKEVNKAESHSGGRLVGPKLCNSGAR
jgi:hypothetical protein